jgi:adenine/guanine phosphoribosyltransferase-like PRPP-binding protein
VTNWQCILATGGTLRAANILSVAAGYNVIDNLVLLDLKYVPRIKDFQYNPKSLIQYE